jgi:phage baseplate assembly protein W
MATFKGFTTLDRVKAPFTITDQELIKRDLLNEFYTKKGERVMRPNFGSIIWDLLMDPNDVDLAKSVEEDIKRIVDKERRVEHVRTTVYLSEHAISADVELRYLPFDNVESLFLLFEQQINEGIE